MVEHVIIVDAPHDAVQRRALGGGRGVAGGSMGVMCAPRQADIEGVGGHFWYEGRV